MTLRRLHRLSALVLGAFIALHLANHLAGLWGQAAHAVTQQALARLYRAPMVEPLLLILFLGQMISGLRLSLPRLRLLRKLPPWSRLQTLSGLSLIAFLIIHISAVLTARMAGVPSDLAFAATAFQAGGLWPWLFAPYYGLAVMAVFLHLAAALRRQRPTAAIALSAAGTTLAISLVLMLMGIFSPISIPPAQIAAFPLMP